MPSIKVSLFASAVRPALWPALFKSLEGTSVSYEVVFAGNWPVVERELFDAIMDDIGKKNGIENFNTKSIFRYINTGNIKPAQCYEIARRQCVGETVVWIADDCEFPGDVIGKAYKYWKSQNNEKLILSIQTKESGYAMMKGQMFPMKMHTFFGFNPQTPLMAPLGLMSRTFLDSLGGIDRRYVCGQYENDIVMRAVSDGGKVEIFGDADCFIDIDHIGKSIAIGESKRERDFLNRPFAKGYAHDRTILEGSWADSVGSGTMLIKDGKYFRRDTFEPFEEMDFLIKSQSHKGQWE